MRADKAKLGQGARVRECAFVLLATGLLLMAGEASAQKRSYTLDTDPIRLGNRALQEGRIGEAQTRFEEAVANQYQLDKAKMGLAEVAIRQGRFADAEPLYREALAAKDDDYPEARARLGLLLLRFGRDLEAGQEFDAALKKQSNLWDAKYGKARLLLKQQKWTEAARFLDEGVGRKGVEEGEDEYHYGMALYYLGKNDLMASEKEALTALDLNPTDPAYGTLVGQIYDKRNVPTLAIDAFEKTLATPGVVATAPMLRTLGNLYEKVGRYTEARDRLVAAAQTDSTYAPALKDLGHLFFLAKEYARSARIYLRYAMLEREDTGALLELAKACFEIRHYDQAVEAARTALSLDESLDVARVELARSGIRTRKPEVRAEAAALFAQLSPTTAFDASDYLALGRYQGELKQYAAARKSLDKAKALDPQQSTAYFESAVIDMRTGQALDAIASLKKAIELKSDAPIYHLNLGIAYFQSRQTAKAIAPFRAALRLDHDLIVGRLLLGQALAANDSISAAQKQYARVIAAQPENEKALRGIGFCYIRQANYSQAQKSYEAAARVDPQSADAWAGLGNAYLGLEDYVKAEAAFEKARAIDPNNPSVKRGLELLQQAKDSSVQEG
jgi:tetratricopeptide (TPR) repeat protein